MYDGIKLQVAPPIRDARLRNRRGQFPGLYGLVSRHCCLVGKPPAQALLTLHRG